MVWSREDYLSAHGSNNLAVQLREFWAEQGYAVRTWFETIRDKRSHDGKEIFCLRSDTINGLPLDYKKK